MQPGKLDQRITIQSETRVPDGYGGSAMSWTAYATRWAAVRSLKGRERLMAQQIESPIDYEFTIRRDDTTAGVTTAMRISWGGKLFNIRAIMDDGPRPLYLKMQAESGVAI